VVLVSLILRLRDREDIFVSITYSIMNRAFARKHVTTIAAAVFAIVYAIIIVSKPAFMYNADGSLRQFGVGYHKKTIAPAWLVAIIVAIASYFGVMYYVAAPKLQF